MKEDYKYKVSVLILTYNATFEKTKMTINSILLQKNVDFQIVISDDGSKENNYSRIIKYFNEIKFTKYLLVDNKENKGTVKNALSGIEKCEGYYVKMISPGDFLSCESVLSDWVSLMDRTQVAVSFCDAIFYKVENNEYMPVITKAFPQVYKHWDSKLCLYYLIYGDPACGATVLGVKEIILKYIKMISENVVYEEDSAYRIMAASGEKMCFYEKPAVYYEFGTGISTQNSKKWSEKLQKDWIATDKMILDIVKSNKWFYKRFKLRLAISLNDSGIKNKFLLSIMTPGFVLFRLKKILIPRLTSKEFDVQYIQKII